jgi:hypothetical protein
MTRPQQEWIDLLTESALSGAPLILSDEILPAEVLREFILLDNPPVGPAGLLIGGIRISGDLDLAHVVFPHPLALGSCRIEGSLILTSAKIGQLSLTGTSVEALHFDGADIDGNARFRGLEATGEVLGLGAHVSRDLILTDAKLTGSDTDALVMDGATIDGTFHAQNLTAAGAVRAIGIRVRGQLVLSGAQLQNAGGTALVLDGAEIDSGLFANEGFRAAGRVRAVGARIGGWVAFDRANVANDGEDNLALDRSTISGILDFEGATLSNPGGDALSLEGAEINGGLLLRRGFNAVGRVRASGIRIRGPLDLSGATLTNPGAVALGLEGAEIALGVFGREGFAVVGQVEAPALRVDGQLDLTGAKLTNPDGYVLRLDGAHIGGDFFACGGFSAVGEIGAPGIRVTGRLILAGATLTNQGDVVSLNSAVVQHLFLGTLSVEGTIDLTRASIDEVEVVGHPPGSLIATGWKVGDLRGPLHNDWSAVDRWLATAPPGVESVQPWHALADVYEQNGNPSGARRLRFAAAKRLTSQSPRWSKAFGYFYRFLVGHGYYPVYAAGWLALLVFVTGVLVANARDEIVPTRPADYTTSVLQHAGETHTPPTAATPCDVHTGYPCMNTVVFTLTNLVPAGGSAPTNVDWAARSDTWLTTALLVSKIVAWGLAALLLAAVTGLLRKT